MCAMKGLLTMAVGLLLVQAVTMAMPLLKPVSKSGCHNSVIVLECSSFNQNQNGNSLRWHYKNPATSTFEKLGKIQNGKLIPYWNGTQFHQRLTLHANGSLEIKSLKSHDETLYRCKVSAPGRRNTHIIDLSVACYGQITHVQKNVCKGDDILLDCDARHRTNPNHLKHTTWRQKTQQGSWHQVATSRPGGRVKANYRNYQFHKNGSLLVQGQANVDRIMFRCRVTKSKTGLPAENHGVEIKYIKCENSTTSAPTIVTLSGRSAVTTAPPASIAQPSTVPSVNPISNVCGGIITAANAGGFHSPNFPNAYPANSDCKWTIIVPRGYGAIDLTIANMNLEQDDNCQHDYIALYDNLGNQVGCRRCGVFKKPMRIQIGGRVAVVVFKTDSDVQKTGFQLTYKAAMQVGTGRR